MTAPARVDLAGGWSDTPPITFDYGGSVVNVALNLGGKHPIGSEAKYAPKGQLILSYLTNSGPAQQIVTNLHELFQNITDPHTFPIAKCAIIAMGLQNELFSVHGLHIRTWSDLPVGSGLGGSSILAATVVLAISRVYGRLYSYEAVTNLVLAIEAMMTTGGGWQDQVLF